ncbi:hypothetical protein GCM10023115_20690 [Pontixanthobacter gangjinensis]|uniref:PilZ domain-containing protein n=1 Tax=Pontixanthobacter gangjinensis TaxID=1028742 RepID=A0A6I4SR21_9SPHN|nr:PilZ domain-containing protein [Pontixanthobacter gangjinensis]MXO57317.1 hypothetical protein [Pontixanthobacter gangjinensis]
MRSYNRFTTDLEIDCVIGRKRHKVALYNLSSGGCMIETPTKDAVQDAEVKIVLTGKAIMPGKIAWRVGKNAGVKFDLPLHQKVVEHFGYTTGEDFDRDDPRDRFGIPIVESLPVAVGLIE